jgi:hypothetical protein
MQKELLAVLKAVKHLKEKVCVCVYTFHTVSVRLHCVLS